MVELMHTAINNMQASFDTCFNKRLPPSLGPSFLKEIQSHYDFNAVKPNMTLEKLQLLVPCLVELEHNI
jgi:hypothetical protein